MNTRLPFRFARLALALAATAGAMSPTAGAATLAASTFDSSAEGWTVQDLPYPNPGAPPVVLGSYLPSFVASGGLPGGHISRLDVSANAWYWSGG